MTLADKIEEAWALLRVGRLAVTAFVDYRTATQGKSLTGALSGVSASSLLGFSNPR